MKRMLGIALAAVALGPAAGSLQAAREVTIPAGTVLRLRLEHAVGSNLSRVEDTVHAHLIDPVVIDDRAVVRAGSTVLGTVTEARPAGKVKGRAELAMRFHTLTRAGDASTYKIRTRQWVGIAPATKKDDAAKIGIPAAGGALIGGLISGRKGAAVGAAAAGGAGTAVVLSTGGKEVRLGRNSVLVVRLSSPLSVRVS